jgi:lactoylglutathione lyase
MAKPIHMMIRVRDEARSVDFYAKAFGLEIAQRADFPDFTLVYLKSPDSPFELELTVNKGRTEPYDLGAGYGHLAVTVDDLDAEHKKLAAIGLPVRAIKEMSYSGQLFGRFFFIEDPDGYKIEVLARAGRFS